jgi:predicted kinase
MKPMTLATPHLIIMVGIPGSGKSFFADHFATTFNAPYVSVASISETTDTSDEVATKVADYMLVELLKTGQTIVYDGDMSSRTSRLDIARRARAKGYEPLFVWVQTESVAAKQRATKKSNVRAISSEQFDTAIRRFTAPNAAEKVVVISGKHTYASQLKIILSRIANERKQIVEPRESIQTGERRNITIR